MTDRLNEIDCMSLGINVSCAVAMGKLLQLEANAFLLGEMVSDGALSIQRAADILHTAALSADLIRVHGDDVIQEIIAAGFEVAA